MAFECGAVEREVRRLCEAVRSLPARPSASVAPAAARFLADAEAACFHLLRTNEPPPLLVVLGGTGTGKSTLVNRLLDREVSATSSIRTFTGGAVAVAADPSRIPPLWLGLPHDPVRSVPARGQPMRLQFVIASAPLLDSITLVDTPDLDGDNPAHHAEADRAFRWADAVVFLVTPEKYQKPELTPYYRLARTYAIPALFVMNKVEVGEAVEDYRRQLAERKWDAAAVFAIPRNDAAWEPPEHESLASLRAAMAQLAPMPPRDEGRRLRVIDAVDRLRDTVLAPLVERRSGIDRLRERLASMAPARTRVNVSPVASELQARMREKSILYLMGPERVLRRAREVPKVLLKLPRTVYELLMRGRLPTLDPPRQAPEKAQPPDFASSLGEQFTAIQNRIMDVLQSDDARPLALADDAETSTSVNVGGGAKIRLAGPLRLRLDYRVFRLQGSPRHDVYQRFYAGANLRF